MRQVGLATAMVLRAAIVHGKVALRPLARPPGCSGKPGTPSLRNGQVFKFDVSRYTSKCIQKDCHSEEANFKFSFLCT